MSKRRAYPQPLYAGGMGPGAAGQPPVGGQFGYGADQAAQQMQGMNLGQPQQPAYGAQPGYGAPQTPVQANAAYGQQQFAQPQAPAANYDQYYLQGASGLATPQQAHAAPYGVGAAPAGAAYPGAAPQAAAYPGAAPGGAPGYASATPGYGQGQGASPLNQIYPCDLLRELPPPISDLTLPPPPIVLPPGLTITALETANASPEYFRLTLNVIPTNLGLLKKLKLPLALVVNPYNALKVEDEQVPVTLDTIISRCRRCRGYINPFVQWAENGRRWRCNFCNLLNDVPLAFDYDEILGQAKNRLDRVELNNAVVEFIAPKEYMARTPQPIVYTFIIDVLTYAVKFGLTATVTRTILELLDRIPNPNTTAKVAFIAVDSSLHYFRFNPAAAARTGEEGEDDEDTELFEQLIVSDIDEPFLPCPDGLLVNLAENRSAIERFLLDFALYFDGTANQLFALGPALKAGHKMISNIGGKLVVFAATLPNVGEGKLAIRDEAGVLGKAKEAKALLLPQDTFYKLFAVTCNSLQITVDLFLTLKLYQDVATLLNLPRFTAGQTHFYPAWSLEKPEDVAKLSREISDHLLMDIALEAVLRVRGSTGFRMSGFYGNFFNRSLDLCLFPTFPRDQSYCIEMLLEETITKPVVYFQAAVLHLTCFGERRIRVMNLAVPTLSKLDDVFALADQLAIATYFTHKAIEKALSLTLGDARDYLTKVVVDLLTVYRKELVAGNVSGALPLQLSTNLRMLPLLLFSLSKHLGLRADRVPLDHRAAALNNLALLPVPHLIKYIYPTVYSLHDMDDDCGLPEKVYLVGPDGEEVETETPSIKLPEPINGSKNNWDPHGLYLIDNSLELFLWLGGDAVPALVHDLFGTDNKYAIARGKAELPELLMEELEFNYRVRQIVAKLREQKDSIVWKNLYIVLGGSNNEPMELSQDRELMALRMWTHSTLVEDKIGLEPTYRDFLSTLKSKVSGN